MYFQPIFKKLLCPICNKKFEKERQYRAHLLKSCAIKKEKQWFKCETCGKNLYNVDFTTKMKFIEVKGFFDSVSKLKLKLLEEQFPEEAKKLIIIDQKRYKRFEEKFKKILQFWETGTFNLKTHPQIFKTIN